MSFHEETIDKLVKRLEKHKGRHLFVLKNVEYGKSEMDVAAVTPKNYMLVFEVKSNYHAKRKAYRQLKKHENKFGKVTKRFYKFYVYPTDKSRKDYRIERIR